MPGYDVQDSPASAGECGHSKKGHEAHKKQINVIVQARVILVSRDDRAKHPLPSR
jgi:hypothetical protein